MNQSQKSLTDQLNELIIIANKNGLYDAADFLLQKLEDIIISRINLENIKSEISDEIYSHPNPYMENGKWYWYDETESLSDPYETEEEAKKDLDRYVSINLNFEGDKSCSNLTDDDRALLFQSTHCPSTKGGE